MIIAGVDCGGRKLAVSIFDGGELASVRSIEVPKTSRARELSQLSSWFEQNTRACELVVIEEPLIGRGVRASLQVAHTYGAALATLGDTHRHTNSYPVEVATWKKQVVGAGNANKDAVRAWLESAHPAYAVQCGANQDRIDAVCIGLYGVQLSERASQLAEL